jgi:murein L,D-transpeptidase YcbB/YkuD
MAGRRNQRNRGLDDWFAEPEPSPRELRRTAPEADAAREHESAPAVADDWLAGESTAQRVPRLGSRLATVDRGSLAWCRRGFQQRESQGAADDGHDHARLPWAQRPKRQQRIFATLPSPALTGLGYSSGAADGSYGPATQRAVARFQKASGLTADGIFGPKTLMALNRAAGP